MFTKNFKNLFIRCLLNQTASGFDTDYYNDTNNPPIYILTNGDNVPKSNYSHNTDSFTSALHNLKTTSGNENTTWLVIGTGTGTVSENDYCLFNQDSNCTCVSAVASTTSNLTKSYTATFQNNSESDITITETGILSNVSIQNKPFNILLEHTILETPVVIPAGETRTITYVWSF